MPFGLQYVFITIVILTTVAVEATWTALLSDFDSIDKGGLVYNSTRNVVMVATILLGNIVIMSFLSDVMRVRVVQGPLYTGVLVAQAFISSALVLLACVDAWVNDAAYEPYYSQVSGLRSLSERLLTARGYGRLPQVTFGALKSMQLQVACLILSWISTGFICVTTFDKHQCVECFKQATDAPYPAVHADDDYGLGGQVGGGSVAGNGIRRRGRSPCAATRSRAAIAATAAEMHAGSEEAYFGHGGEGGPQFYVPQLSQPPVQHPSRARYML